MRLLGMDECSSITRISNSCDDAATASSISFGATNISNGKSALQQTSISSSSCDSDPNFVKMPILSTSYALTPELSCNSNYNSQDMQLKNLTAGEILMNSSSLKRRKHSFKETILNGGFDEVDTAITRNYKKETLIYEKSLDEQLNGSQKSISQQSPAAADNSNPVIEPQAHPKPTCCSVFCALFSWEEMFKRYSIIDLLLNIGAVSLYFFDLITDWINAVAYLFRQDDEDYLIYFYLTLIFIVAPSLIMHTFSAWWEIEDNRHVTKEMAKRNLKNKLGCFYYFSVSLFHIFQIAPVYRYFRTMYFGIKSRYMEKCKETERLDFYDRKYKAELSEVNLIRLMESFLEAAPQNVLQIYIMIRTVQAPLITVLSVSVSLIGMAISFVTYQRALRNSLKEKKQLSIFATITLFLFRFFTILSRVIALALLLNINIWAWIGFFVGHWIIMTLFIACQETKFCGNSTCKEYLYDIVIGFCYTFAYVNVLFGRRNRYRMLLYYTLTLLENTAIVVCWFYFRRGGGSLLDAIRGLDSDSHVMREEGALSDNMALAFVIAVVGLFFFGMLFFFVYYLIFHPNALGANLCLTANDESAHYDKSQVLSTHLSCGDNYRTSSETRDSRQFRSWHSASLDYNPELSASLKRNRPSSEIISSTNLYDPLQVKASTLETKTEDHSCNFLKDDAVSFQKQPPGDVTNKAGPEPVHKGRSSASSYAKAIFNNSSAAKYKSDITDEAELKRRRVSALLEQKQREKWELEQRQALLRRSLERKQTRSVLSSNKTRSGAPARSEYVIRDLFDRKRRAQHLYFPESHAHQNHVTPTSLQHRTVHAKPTSLQDRTVLTNPVFHRSQTGTETIGSKLAVTQHNSPLLSASRNHNDSNSTYRSRHVISGGGTFPRCSRPSSTSGTPSRPPFLRGGSLKPISEVQRSEFADRRSTASLMDLALPRYPKLQSVPRAMSFTISKNEVVESIESSL